MRSLPVKSQSPKRFHFSKTYINEATPLEKLKAARYRALRPHLSQTICFTMSKKYGGSVQKVDTYMRLSRNIHLKDYLD
jgi:hypothetical protein